MPQDVAVQSSPGLLVCWFARDVQDTCQGHTRVDKDPEVGTRGLWSGQMVFAFLGKGPVLTNKPGLDRIEVPDAC